MCEGHARFVSCGITSEKTNPSRKRNRKKTIRLTGEKGIIIDFHETRKHRIVSSTYRFVFDFLATKASWYWFLPFISFVEAMEETQTTTDHPVQNGNEYIMILLMSGLLGICISFVGIIICYFFLLEGMLMRTYYYDGIPIEGRIKNVTFFRSTGRNSESEYTAELDYRYQDIGGYSTVVHKQIKVLDSDLSNLREKEKVTQKLESGDRIVIHIDMQDFEKEFHSDCSDQSSDKNVLDMSVHLEVVLIPYHPNSGVPKFLVERSFEASSRFKTAAIIGFLFLTSFVSVHWGVTASQLDISASSLSNFYLSLLVTLSFWLIIAVPVHCFLRKLLEKALIDEYLEGGDTLIKLDDETLATMSSRSASSCEGDPLPVDQIVY
jgi:hypothetical protein